jgi:hypothetical protein
VLQLIAAGRQRLLPGQVCRHLRLDMQDIGAQQTGMTKDSSRPSSWPRANNKTTSGEKTMAQLIGGIGTSHIPAIGGAIHKGLQQDPYWKPFFDGFPPVREWLGEKKPDVLVIFYNDHGLNFFLDKMPTFAVGAARAICQRG